ncbi:podocalyxin isoform X2 [Tachyglossus aculeatus]|uniref:podocalyxin isoform X2 n=1 Tax=Tachyglossus aculeatus TaxID=9261 RepID=UPI0018F3618E|nr:podocalyxin isoform X2 [Tachyglossus aculeatus]
MDVRGNSKAPEAVAPHQSNSTTTQSVTTTSATTTSATIAVAPTTTTTTSASSTTTKTTSPTTSQSTAAGLTSTTIAPTSPRTEVGTLLTSTKQPTSTPGSTTSPKVQSSTVGSVDNKTSVSAGGHSAQGVSPSATTQLTSPTTSLSASTSHSSKATAQSKPASTTPAPGSTSPSVTGESQQVTTAKAVITTPEKTLEPQITSTTNVSDSKTPSVSPTSPSSSTVIATAAAATTTTITTATNLTTNSGSGLGGTPNTTSASLNSSTSPTSMLPRGSSSHHPATSPSSSPSTGLTTSPSPSDHDLPWSQPPGPAVPDNSSSTAVLNMVTCEDWNSTSDKDLILEIRNPCENFQENPFYLTLCQLTRTNFNKSRDLCHVRLGHQPGQWDRFTLIEVSVKTTLGTQDLVEVLKDKWEDLKQAGVTNITYAGKLLEGEDEDRFSMPLIITIVCMASFLLLVAAVYGCCHQRLALRKDQQRLTEELQTVENGYHDNPTLEVMETSSEMQEKKVANLNGELGDSWIVPLDDLTKDDLDEEDTHL